MQADTQGCPLAELAVDLDLDVMLADHLAGGAVDVQSCQGKLLGGRVVAGLARSFLVVPDLGAGVWVQGNDG